QQAVRLHSVAAISRLKTGNTIRRENQQYLLNVHYRFIGTYFLNDLVRSRVIKHVQPMLPHGYTVYNPDAGRWFREPGSDGQSAYLWLLPLVLVVIYMVCAVL